MSSFMAKKLDIFARDQYLQSMPKKPSKKRRRSTAETVRERVERGGARVWKYGRLPATAAGRAGQATLPARRRRAPCNEIAEKGVHDHPELTVLRSH